MNEFAFEVPAIEPALMVGPRDEADEAIAAIQRNVARVMNVPLRDLLGKPRTQHIAFARQVAMYLCRKRTQASYPTIGECFNRDHSTVIHSHQEICRRLKDDAFRRTIERIERQMDETDVERLSRAQFMPMQEAL
jgi:chromosomal replication initiator protein